jgi:hypothetical protein
MATTAELEGIEKESERRVTGFWGLTTEDLKNYETPGIHFYGDMEIDHDGIDSWSLLTGSAEYIPKENKIILPRFVNHEKIRKATTRKILYALMFHLHEYALTPVCDFFDGVTLMALEDSGIEDCRILAKRVKCIADNEKKVSGFDLLMRILSDYGLSESDEDYNMLRVHTGFMYAERGLEYLKPLASSERRAIFLSNPKDVRQRFINEQFLYSSAVLA